MISGSPRNKSTYPVANARNGNHTGPRRVRAAAKAQQDLDKNAADRDAQNRLEEAERQAAAAAEKARQVVLLAQAHGDRVTVLPPGFKATLHSIDGVRIADGKAFDDKGEVTQANVRVLDIATAQSLAAALASTGFEVTAIEQKPANRKAPIPFTTSTLQQEAGRKLRFSSKRTMDLAQGFSGRQRTNRCIEQHRAA